MKAAILGMVLLMSGAQQAVGIGNDNPPSEGGSSTNTNTIGIVVTPTTTQNSTAVSGSSQDSKSTAISGANSDSKSTAISGDSTSVGIGVGGDSKAFATGGNSKSNAVSGDSSSSAVAGDSKSSSITGDSKSYSAGGTAVAGDQSAKSGDVSLSIQGDNFPEIAQSAASVIAQSCQEGSSAQGISAGLSAVFDSAQCTYIRQASINLSMQQMYYSQGMENTAELYLQRAVKYIDRANTATDVTAPARAVGGIAVSLLPIAALILIL